MKAASFFAPQCDFAGRFISEEQAGSKQQIIHNKVHFSRRYPPYLIFPVSMLQIQNRIFPLHCLIIPGRRIYQAAFPRHSHRRIIILPSHASMRDLFQPIKILPHPNQGDKIIRTAVSISDRQKRSKNLRPIQHQLYKMKTGAKWEQKLPDPLRPPGTAIFFFPDDK